MFLNFLNLTKKNLLMPSDKERFMLILMLGLDIIMAQNLE